MTGTDFLSGLALLVFFLYVFEIGWFLYNRQRHPEVFKSFLSSDIEHLEIIVGTPTFAAAFWIAFGYNILLSFAKGIINPVVLGITIVGILCAALNEILKPQMKIARRGGKQEAQPKQQDAKPTEEDGDFGFDPGRFNSGGGTGWSTSEAEADYESALQQAQTWADQSASKETASGYANKFEKLSKNPSLHPKDRLRYKLTVMLLRERLKGQKAQQKPAAQQEPSNNELRILGLPVPNES